MSRLHPELQFKEYRILYFPSYLKGQLYRIKISILSVWVDDCGETYYDVYQDVLR